MPYFAVAALLAALLCYIMGHWILGSIALICFIVLLVEMMEQA